MRTTGMNLSGVRENNRALLLQLICTSKNITRSELSQRSHLSTMTVTNITTELLHSNIIVEEAPQDYSKMPGRIPMLLHLSPHSPVICGIFLSKDNLCGVLSDMSLNLLVRETIPFEQVETAESILEKMRALAHSLISQTTRQVLAVGVSAVGVIDVDNGVVRYVTDLFGIRDLEIRSGLSSYLHLPVFVYADMQAAGLSELYFGALRQEPCFLYVGLCNGIGASVVINHELMDSCGEIGHMCIDWTGPRCSCGNNGCLELYASTPSILKQIHEECGVQLDSLAAAVELSSKNRTAYSVLYNAVQKLCFAINNYLNLINVPTVILGHEGYCLPDELLTYMEDRISRINVSLHQRPEKLHFLKSTFGTDAALYGSICVVLEQLFRNRFSLDALSAHGMELQNSTEE